MMVPMISSLAGLWLIRVPAAYFLAANFGRDSMYFCYALGWVPAIAIAWGFYLTGRWKRKAVVPQKKQSRKKVRLTGADFFTGNNGTRHCCDQTTKNSLFSCRKAKIWYNRSKKRRIFAKRLKSAEGIA